MKAKTKQDADAIAFGVKMYAEVIKEEIKTQEQENQLVDIIMKQSIKFVSEAYGGPGHD